MIGRSNVSCYGLTGGGLGALDSVLSTSLTNNGISITLDSGDIYFHYWDSTSAAAESSPDVIKPDNLGVGDAGRWLLLDVWIGPDNYATAAEITTGTEAAKAIAPDQLLSSPTVAALTVTNQLTINGASRMRATKATTQSIPNAAWTIVQYNTEMFDNLNEYDNATNYRFTATAAGYYSVSASLLSANAAWDAGESWLLSLYKNGVQYNNGVYSQSGIAVTAHKHSLVNDTIYLAVNDYIDMRGYHNQGAAVNTHTDAAYNYFSVHRLS